MNKLFSFFINVCFVLSIMIIVAGCAKKAPVAPVAPKDEARMSEESLSDSPDKEPSFGRSREAVSKEAVSKEAEEEFQAASGSLTSVGFTAAPGLPSVHFNFDRYVVRTEDNAILSANADWLGNNPGVSIQIAGHCDSRGTLDYNLALGDKRANAVKDYLVSLGVNSSRIFTISYGEERSLCNEENETCWSQNRRGEFHLAK